MYYSNHTPNITQRSLKDEIFRCIQFLLSPNALTSSKSNLLKILHSLMYLFASRVSLCEAKLLAAEKRIVTWLPDGKRHILGDVDYAVGYGGGKKEFDSALLVVEAKNRNNLVDGEAQCLAYMGA